VIRVLRTENKPYSRHYASVGFEAQAGLLIWPPFWDVLGPLGVNEKDARPVAITTTITAGVIGCALLMLRALLPWVRNSWPAI